MTSSVKEQEVRFVEEAARNAVAECVELFERMKIKDRELELERVRVEQERVQVEQVKGLLELFAEKMRLEKEIELERLKQGQLVSATHEEVGEEWETVSEEDGSDPET